MVPVIKNVGERSTVETTALLVFFPIIKVFEKLAIIRSLNLGLLKL